MAPDVPQHAIRSASSVEEASELWWPLMQELGWNRAKADAQTHFQVAQNGKNWLLLIPQETHKPEGCVIALSYPNHTGWVAFFIINAAFRGRGLGRQLWNEMDAVFHVNGTTVIGLDGVEEQVETYKRRGFEDCARIPLMVRDSLKLKPLGVQLDLTEAAELQDLRDVDPKQLAQLDLEHTGLDRSAYWSPHALLSRRGAFGLAIVSNSQVTGFVFVRRCEHGHRVGPLYAETYAQAKQLLHKAMNDSANSNGSYVAEIFGTNPAGRKVFEELGWVYPDLSYHRMWLHGKIPEEQKEGGKGAKGMYAIFDACAG
ncbi:Nn.00g044820.m01.CDS01 [Neocucurbitaria sp. VM-36]